LWQVAHAIVSFRDSRVSKYSAFPRAILSTVIGLSTGMRAKFLLRPSGRLSSADSASVGLRNSMSAATAGKPSSAAAPVANSNTNKRHTDFLEAHMSIPCFLAYRPFIQTQR
jgi:hypothetical protein|tara:strand:- start:843 stop:1178 length:336 start_codon:yes stop_codon:yes gene_type:complete